MDDTQDRGPFNYAIEQFGLKFSEPVAAANFEAYWMRLQMFSIQVVEAAFKSAERVTDAKEPPPTADTVAMHARAIERKWNKAKAEDLRKKLDEAEETVKKRKAATPTPEPVNIPQSETAKRFHALAKKFEEESGRLRLNQNAPTPAPIFRERMKEFWEMWTRSGREKVQ